MVQALSGLGNCAPYDRPLPLVRPIKTALTMLRSATRRSPVPVVALVRRQQLLSADRTPLFMTYRGPAPRLTAKSGARFLAVRQILKSATPRGLISSLGLGALRPAPTNLVLPRDATR